MGLFGKKGKHSLIDVIRYDGSPEVLVWKHDSEDFNTNCQLIVQEGQEAVFIKNGQALESFLPGRYTLTTENYPFIRSLVGLVTGGICPFQCSVYYVNKAVSMGLEWGTDSPIRMQDPVYKLPINITAYGDFSVRVENSKRLLLSLISTAKGFSQDEIQEYFRGILASKIRSVITASMIKHNLSPLGIDAYLDVLSGDIQTRLGSEFLKYGLSINHFALMHIGYSGLEEVESTLGKQMVADINFTREAERTRKKTDVDVESKLKHGQADNAIFLQHGKYVAEVNNAQGITELQKQMIGVAEKQAENPGPILGGTNIGLGLGSGEYQMGGYGGGLKTTGANATESLKIIAGITNPVKDENMENPVFDGAMPDGIGGIMEDEKNKDDFSEKVSRLRTMKEAGLLSDQEFENLRKKLIDEALGD